MLALPILTGLAGFFPSLLALLAAWMFMTFTALLLVEVNGWFQRPVNLLSMAQESLGVIGRWVGWVSYLFLFYALLVSYLSVSGSIVSTFLQEFLGINAPPWSASLLFTAGFGLIIYLGTRPVDLVNRALMVGLIVAYVGMIGLGLTRIHPAYLFHAAPSYMLLSLPVLVISFGFQNMIPSLTNYMMGDLRRVRLAILIGSGMALLVYLLWSVLVLGVVPPDGPGGILETYHRGEEATFALRGSLGNSKISYFAGAFALFAIVTSFLAQGLALMHFIADGLKKNLSRKNSWWLCCLALLPPLFFSLSVQQVFFKALNLAGGIFAMILFGLLPIGMAWVGRYRKKIASPYHVRGGKPALVFAGAFALLVIVCELNRIL